MRPGRQAALLEDARDAQQGQRTVAGRLADDGVAGAERGADLVGVELDRVVEGHDGEDDPDGLAQREGHVPLRAGHGVHRHLPAEEPLGFLAEALDDADGGAHLFAGLPDRLAVLLGEQAGEVLLLGGQPVSGPEEDVGASVGRQSGYGVPGSTGCLDGARESPPPSQPGHGR